MTRTTTSVSSEIEMSAQSNWMISENINKIKKKDATQCLFAQSVNLFEVFDIAHVSSHTFLYQHTIKPINQNNPDF